MTICPQNTSVSIIYCLKSSFVLISNVPNILYNFFLRRPIITNYSSISRLNSGISYQIWQMWKKGVFSRFLCLRLRRTLMFSIEHFQATVHLNTINPVIYLITINEETVTVTKKHNLLSKSSVVLSSKGACVASDC